MFDISNENMCFMEIVTSYDTISTNEKMASGQLDLNHLNSGVFFVRVTTREGVVISRLIINE